MLEKELTPPKTYSEWINILNQLKSKIDDEKILSVMQKGVLEWQSGVAERFLKKLIDVVNYRMNEATDKFQKDMHYANGSERVIVQSLLALRKELSFLSNVVNLPAIPEQKRLECYDLIVSQADTIQRSLEESAQKERTGKLVSIVRNNKVNTF